MYRCLAKLLMPCCVVLLQRAKKGRKKGSPCHLTSSTARFCWQSSFGCRRGRVSHAHVTSLLHVFVFTLLHNAKKRKREKKLLSSFRNKYSLSYLLQHLISRLSAGIIFKSKVGKKYILIDDGLIRDKKLNNNFKCFVCMCSTYRTDIHPKNLEKLSST